MSEETNVIRIDFHQCPEDNFRSIMVDVFKRYFAMQTLEGVPNAFTVENVLFAMQQAIREEGAYIDIFSNALTRFASEQYGYRVMSKDDFDKLRNEVLGLDDE